MTIPRSIRPIAIGIIQDEQGRLLLFEAEDPVKGDTFYRPLGGEIEFGELGAEGLAREFQEEIGAELEGITYLGTIENRFTYAGEPGHEIVLVYQARLVDPHRYRDGPILVHEETTTLLAHWMPRRPFEEGAARLVPEGLLDLLHRQSDE